MTGTVWPILLASESRPGFSAHGLALLFEATVKGTLILLIAVVLVLLLRRSSAAARHLVWSLALGAMLLLPIFSLTLPAWNVLAISPPLTRSASEPAVLGRKDYPVALYDDKAGQSHPVSRPAPLADGDGGFPMWATGALFLWAIGLMLVSMRMGVGEVRVRRLVNCSQPFESGPAMLIMEQVCSRLHLTSHTQLRMSPQTGVPFTWGGLRPVIVLPESAYQWSAKQLNFVLAHELAHVSRYDYLAQMPAQAACALFWFHPLVWLAAFQMRKERERACDDMVLNLENRGTDYAEFLLILARGLRRSGDTWLTGAATGQISQLEVRMKALLDPQLNHRPLSGCGALLATAFAVGLILPVAAIHATDKKATGNITGTVHDSSRAVIPGAHVTVVNLETHARINTETGDDGSFEFPGFPEGRYQIEVTKPGFAEQRSPEFELNSSKEIHEDMILDVGVVSEEIVVRGHAPDVAPTVPPPTPRRIRVGGLVQAAKLINQVWPIYPASAEKRGIQGTVILRAVIGTSGQMLSVSPYNDVDPDLTSAAMEAVRQWRYQPTLLNGVPVEVVTTISVVFRLGR